MYDFGHVRQTLHWPLGYVDNIPISNEVLVKSIELHRSILKGRTLATLGSRMAGICHAHLCHILLRQLKGEEVSVAQNSLLTDRLGNRYETLYRHHELS
jgi:hypothetical protein